MKKLSAIILAALLAVCTLASCAPGQPAESTQTSSAVSETQETSGEPASASDSTQPSAEASAAQSSQASNAGTSSASQSSQASKSESSSSQSSQASRSESSSSQSSQASRSESSSSQSSQPSRQESSSSQSSQPSRQESSSSQSSQPSRQESSSSQSSQPSRQESSSSQVSQPSRQESSAPQTSQPPKQESSVPEASQSSQPDPAPVSASDMEIYNALFNIESKIQVQIKMQKSEMDKMQQDYKKYYNKGSKSPIYRKADVVITVNGKSYEINEVGIRLKGNMSLSPVYGKNGGLNLSHYKLSFNETFDDKNYYGSDAKVWSSKELRKERKKRRFATLKKLDIKWNSIYDDTHIREYYAAEMFRQMGVLVQRQGLSQLVFNGSNYGLVKIYEPVDEIFLEKNLPQAALGGDLYKCGWTMKPCNYVKSKVTYGVSDNDKGTKYNFDLKTNEKNSKHESLKNLLDVLSSSPSKQKFEQVVDTDYLARFLAVSYFAGDPDDMRNNYNNHYVYFRKDTGKAIFIVYDNDRTLGLTYGYNPDGTGMTAQKPYSDRAAGMGNTQENPLINYGILRSGYCKDKYASYLEQVTKLPLWNEQSFNSVYEKVRKNYESIVQPSIKFDNVKKDFKFSLDGKYGSSDKQNMSFSDFFTRINHTYINNK